MKAKENNTKTIKSIYSAQRGDVADLITYSPLPINNDLKRLEPFLILSHHGLQIYPPHNDGLPFGPHPHRGFETVTFIQKGDLKHKDSGGYQSVIKAGGVQWMTAGSGLIHAEVSSDEFKETGGEIEILQLWVNLPAKHKMTKPLYIGLQKDEIKTVSVDNGKVKVNLVSGTLGEVEGAIKPLTDVFISTIDFKKDGKFGINVDSDKTVLFYVISGNLTVNGKSVESRQLVEFDKDGERIEIEAATDAVIIFGYAEPHNEPIAAAGPFVMNTQEELRQVMEDYRAGKFGVWEA